MPIVNDSPDDAARFKNRLSEMIETEGIGTVTGSGMGASEMDLSVQVGESEDATPRLRALLESFGVGDIAKITESES